MFLKKILILDNKEIASDYFLMELASPEIAQNSSPGQFLHIKCSRNHNPLLRRPFSIHRVIDEKCIEILYKVVGKGTLCLSKRKKGEKIDCIGPLGNGFKLKNMQTAIVVAGGIGIAPLIFLAEKLAKSKIISFLGAKTKNEILCTKDFKSLGAKVNIATEDGSLGYKGMVSDLLKDKLSSIVHHISSIIYACGPKEMLKEIAFLSKEHKIPCQVSFEQFMGCGIGICNSCVIRTKQGYRRVCKDGPVFNTEEIDWERI
jgi:dihydroorotate dehydrogenase electron transfer subunit